MILKLNTEQRKLVEELDVYHCSNGADIYDYIKLNREIQRKIRAMKKPTVTNNLSIETK